MHNALTTLDNNLRSVWRKNKELFYKEYYKIIKLFFDAHDMRILLKFKT
jgi:hypothetical protein